MVRIRFTDFKIDRIRQSSGVFTGQNRQAKWRHWDKINEGFGRISGEDNQTNRSVHLVHDRDMIDMNTGKDRP